MQTIKTIAPLYRHLSPTFAKLPSARALSTTTSLLPRPLLQTKLTDSIKVQNTHQQSKRPFTATSTTNMTDSFSNTDTGSKPSDPYKHKNLDNNASLRDKVEDLVQFIDSSKFGMMTTRAQNGLLVSRCMALAAKEGGGLDLLFHTNTESGKTDDLHKDPSINISFLNSSGEWASISGEASIVTDRDMVRKYYSRELKAWIGDLGDGKHDAGPEDPRIGVIKVNAKTATYAVSDRSAVSRGVQIAKGVVTGDSPNVHKLRELDTDEIQQWKQMHQSS